MNSLVFYILIGNVLSFIPSDMQNKTGSGATERKMNILQKINPSWTHNREPLGVFDARQVFIMVSLS